MTPLFEALRGRVKPLLRREAAHDWPHVRRVYLNALELHSRLKSRSWAGETPPGFDLPSLEAAALLHEIGPKSPGGPNAIVERKQIAELLDGLGFSDGQIIAVYTAVNEHSWSRNLVPSTPASAVLQDADRLDATGAFGVARCMAYSASVDRPILDPDGGPDAVGHFYQKLVKIPARLNFDEARDMARERHAFLLKFLEQIALESRPSSCLDNAQ